MYFSYYSRSLKLNSGRVVVFCFDQANVHSLIFLYIIRLVGMSMLGQIYCKQKTCAQPIKTKVLNSRIVEQLLNNRYLLTQTFVFSDMIF